MKIVFATMFLENAGGGLGRVAHEIPFAFGQKENDVLFVSGGLETKVVRKGRVINLQIKSAGGELSFPNLSWENIRFLFKNLSEFSPKTIHVHDPGPLSFLLQMWAKENGVSFFYTSHVLPTKLSDFGSREFSKELGRLLDSRLLKKYFLNFYNSCDGIIALNKVAENDIKKFGYKGQIFVIPNGRNLELYKDEKVINLSKEKHLVFVGWLSVRKNQKYLLEVMRFLPKSYSLDLIGGALSEKYLSELKKYAQKYKLNNVNFVGQVDYSKIPKYLQGAFAFVSASKMEVQSLVILEALASGTPVIGLANETVDELIDERVGVRLPKNTSAKDFAKEVEKLASLNSLDYKKMSENTRGRVKDFSWDNVVDQTVSAYTSVRKHKVLQNEVRYLKKDDWEKILEKIRWPKFLKFQESFGKGEKLSFPQKDFYIFLVVLIAFLGNSLVKVTKLIKELREKDWLSLE